MTIQEHLKRKRADHHLTLDDVAAIVGVSRQTIQKYESGVISNIPYEKVERLARALQTTPAVLMGWQDERDAPPPSEEPHPTHVKSLPFLAGASGGELLFAREDFSTYAFSDDDPGCDFALPVVDDSMQPTLLEGDTVFIRQQKTIADGQIAAVLVEGVTLLRHVYSLPDSAGLQLISDNTAYAPLFFSSADMAKVQLLGLAVAYQRKLSQK